MKRLLIIGYNSLVSRSFTKLYSADYLIDGITKNNNLNELNNKSYDVIIYLAQSNEYKKDHMSSNLFNVNVSLVHKVLNRFKNNNTTMIYFSTGSVYKDIKSGLYTNKSEVNYSEPGIYAGSKLAGEIIAKTFCKMYKGINIIRPFTIYGVDQKNSMLFPLIIEKIKSNIPIHLSGKRGLIFNPIFSDDVAIFLNKLIQTNNEGINVFNLGGNEIIDLNYLIDTISEIINKTPTKRIVGNTNRISACKNENTFFSSNTSLVQGLKIILEQ